MTTLSQSDRDFIERLKKSIAIGGAAISASCVPRLLEIIKDLEAQVEWYKREQRDVTPVSRYLLEAKDAEIKNLEAKLEVAEDAALLSLETIALKAKEIERLQSVAAQRLECVELAQHNLAAKDAEIAKLREALEPFSMACYSIPTETKDTETLSDEGFLACRGIMIGDLRRAREALKGQPK